jgi:hypothetical protein
MGGKSGPSNNQMVQFEMQQAAEAKQKENKRQARLDQGKGIIDTMFSNENFGDPFYDKYKNAELAYTMPQLQTQYDTAKNNMTYDLARAGTLRSSAAGYAQKLLEGQNAVNEAGIRAKADTDTAALRDSIASQKNQSLNQLYQTEDPTVAANTAANSVANAQLQQPNTGALGDLFKPIAIGLGSALAPVYGQYEANRALTAATGRQEGSGKTST